MANMGNVWDRTTEFVSDNLAAIMPVALLAIFVPQSVSSALGDIVNQRPDAAPLLWLIITVLTLPVIWGQLAIVALALGAGGSRGAATRAFGWAVLISLILGILVMLLALPIPVALVLGGLKPDLLAHGRMISAMSEVGSGVRLFVLLYALFWVVAVAFLFVRVTALAHPALIAERAGLGAIKRSFDLTRGITWKLIGVFLLFFIVSTVAGLAIRSAFGFVFAVIGAGSGPLSLGGVIVTILVGMVATAYCVVVAVFQAKLYQAVVGVPAGTGVAA